MMIQSKLFLTEKKYILYIKRLHVHHVKTMCFIHSYPQKCLLKSEQTGIENKMYSTLATLAVCYLYKYSTFKMNVILFYTHSYIEIILIKPVILAFHLFLFRH